MPSTTPSTLASAVAVIEAARVELRSIEQRQAELRSTLAALGGDAPKGATGPGTATAPALTYPHVTAGSSTDLAIKVLQRAGEPLTVDDLVKRAKQWFGAEVARDTLLANICRYVARGSTFTRVGRGLYGLAGARRSHHKQTAHA